MPSLPVLSGRDVVAVFAKLGWQVGHNATLSVPDHREVDRGTLRSLIRASGLSVDDFVATLHK